MLETLSIKTSFGFRSESWKLGVNGLRRFGVAKIK